MSLFQRIFSLLGILTLVACGSAQTTSRTASASAVADKVQSLAGTLNVDHVPTLKGKTVATSSDDVETMLREYNVKAHPRSANHNRIVLDAKHVSIGRLVASVADDADLTELVGDRAVETAQDLKGADAVLGFDGDGMDGCGSGEIYALVLDRAAQRVFSVETRPCEQ